MSVRRPQWDDLPRGARAAVESKCGAVLKAESASDGIMPGVAARLHTESGRVFVKAIPNHSRAVRLYVRERDANLALADGVPAPRMLWSGDAEGWMLLLFEFIERGRSADLSPTSPDLPGVLDALSRLGRAGGPLPPVSVNLEVLREKAAALLAQNLDGPQWGMYADALDRLSWTALAGDALLHYDLHGGNLLTAGGRTYLIDWSFACRGAAWIDAAMLVPRLVGAGHTPAQAESLMAAVPAWKAAPADAVTGLAALWTMFREYKTLHGPQEGRAFRARAAEAGRSWMRHRMR